MPTTARLPIHPDAHAAGGARTATRALLADWGLHGAVVDDALLAVSELVSNAVRHAGRAGELALELDRSPQRLCVAVTDASPELPRSRSAADTDEDGRGLRIVAALGDRWGSEVRAGGKRVWLEFDLYVTA